jgi:hypothetical protein
LAPQGLEGLPDFVQADLGLLSLPGLAGALGRALIKTISAERIPARLGQEHAA